MSSPDFIVDINGNTILIDSFVSAYKETFGRQLQEARKACSLTQKELAELADIERANVTRIENGNYNPSLVVMAKLAEALGKEIKIIFVDKE